MEYKLDDKINFGKHRGKTIQEVIDANPSYIIWCVGAIDGFELDDEAQEYLEYTNWGMDDYYDNSWRDGHPLDYGG